MSDPARYAVEYYARNGEQLRDYFVGAHDTLASAVDAATRALWSPHPPLVAEVRIVDTPQEDHMTATKMVSEQEAYDFYVESCHENGVWAQHFNFSEWRAMGRPRSISKSDGNWPTPWPDGDSR